MPVCAQAVTVILPDDLAGVGTQFVDGVVVVVAAFNLAVGRGERRQDQVAIDVGHAKKSAVRQLALPPEHFAVGRIECDDRIDQKRRRASCRKQRPAADDRKDLSVANNAPENEPVVAVAKVPHPFPGACVEDIHVALERLQQLVFEPSQNQMRCRQWQLQPAGASAPLLEPLLRRRNPGSVCELHPRFARVNIERFHGPALFDNRVDIPFFGDKGKPIAQPHDRAFPQQ